MPPWFPAADRPSAFVPRSDLLMPQRSKRIEQDCTRGRHSHANAGGRQQNPDRKEVGNKVEA